VKAETLVAKCGISRVKVMIVLSKHSFIFTLPKYAQEN